MEYFIFKLKIFFESLAGMLSVGFYIITISSKNIKNQLYTQNGLDLRESIP